MKASVILLVVLGMVATGICIPGFAQAMDEIVLQFRSLEVGNVVPAEVCERGYDFLGVGERGLPAYTVLVMLDAELWASQTRAVDGMVVNPEVRQVGTGSACVWMDPIALFAPIDPTQPLTNAPIYGEFQVGDLFFPVAGEATLTSNTIPVPGVALAVGSMIIPPDESQGLLGGVASSNSVFNLLQLPGFQTGSFWTVHIYRETE